VEAGVEDACPSAHGLPSSASVPVRVCFLIDRLSRAGTETQLLALIRTLDRRRIQPYLAILDGEDELSRALEPPDCRVLRLGVRSLASRSALAAARRFGRFLRRQRINVVQAYFLDSVYFGVPVAKLAGVPHVIRVRNNLGYWLTRKHRLLDRIYRRITDFTLTNSERGRQALITEGMRPDQIVVIENGVDVERFENVSPPDTAKARIGVVANLRPVKRLDLLIRAIAEIVELCPQTRLEIAGDGEQRPELERLIADVGLRQWVRLHGPVADVPEFLRGLDVAVLCSSSEGMSNALLEYMAAGRAIVATRVGANDQLIRDGIEGILIPPDDVDALVAALRRLLTDPPLAARLGGAARARASESFSRDAMRRRFENWYVDISSSHSRFQRTGIMTDPARLPGERGQS
jgi:glycosyltransferase involved in cell wall biosynthesis